MGDKPRGCVVADFGQQESLLLDRSWRSKISYASFQVSHPSTSSQRSSVNKWSVWQELNLRGHLPKTCGWPLPYTRIWWLGTELNRIHWLFRPALCRRVPEPNLVDGARIELAFHGCRPRVIPLYEPPIWGEMRESNSRDWIHNPIWRSQRESNPSLLIDSQASCR